LLLASVTEGPFYLDGALGLTDIAGGKSDSLSPSATS
jgi:hypothetical protein